MENLQSANYKIYIEQKILLLIEFIDKNSFQEHIDVEDSLFNECSFYQDNSWKFFGKRSIILYYSIGVIYRTKMLLATKTRKLFGQEAIKLEFF